MAGTAKKSTEIVANIQRIKSLETRIRLKSLSPLVVHAWSEKAKRQMIEAQAKKTKTKGREVRRPFQEFVDSMYWLTEKPVADTDEELEKLYEKAIANGARFGFPVGGIKQAANSAAYRLGWVKNQMGLRGSYFLGTEDGEFAEIKGCVPKIRTDMVRVGNGAADVRYRAEFDDWYMDLTIAYNANSDLTLEQIVNCIEAGGFACGIGEWRPEKDGTFGRYVVEVV